MTAKSDNSEKRVLLDYQRKSLPGTNRTPGRESFAYTFAAFICVMIPPLSALIAGIGVYKGWAALRGIRHGKGEESDRSWAIVGITLNAIFLLVGLAITSLFPGLLFLIFFLR
jgi:hypothetical protein